MEDLLENWVKHYDRDELSRDAIVYIMALAEKAIKGDEDACRKHIGEQGLATLFNYG